MVGQAIEISLMTADLEGWMRARGIRAQVVPLGGPAPTVVLAAQALGVGPQAVLKSLVFLVEGRPHLVVARGTARVDPGRLAGACGGQRARLANPVEVRAATGYGVGEMPPFGHLAPLPTLVDRGVVEPGVGAVTPDQQGDVEWQRAAGPRGAGERQGVGASAEAVVYTGAGGPDVMLKMTVAELMRATGGRVADLTPAGPPTRAPSGGRELGKG